MDTNVIINALMRDKDYAVKVLPHIKEEYFLMERNQKILFKIISSFIKKYKKVPSPNVIKIEIGKLKMSDDLYNDLIDLIDNLSKLDDGFDIDYVYDLTERWCKDRAYESAILNATEHLDNSEKRIECIRKITDSQTISFDNSLGIDFFSDEDIKKRFDKYKNPEKMVETGIERLDSALNGGFEQKTINMFLGSTGTGKTNILCSQAASFISRGFDTLYVTLEMSEEKISQRIEANLFGKDMTDLPNVKDFESYRNMFYNLKSKTFGRYFIKEYPTSTITTLTIEKLLNDYKMKKNFIPKVIIVDYAGIMVSHRVKNDSSYNIGKAVIEELRALFQINNVVGLTAVQTGRAGHQSSKISLDNIAESWGVAMTADTVIAIVSTPEHRERNMQEYQILKSRTGGIGMKIPVKVDFSQARVVDMDEVSNIDMDLGLDSKLENVKFNKNKFVYTEEDVNIDDLAFI